MEKRIQISASDLASILAIWTVAYIGCKNAVSSALETHLPLYFSELLKPDSPTFGISKQVELYILFTVFMSFLLFFRYDVFMQKLNSIESSLIRKLKKIYIKEIVIISLFTVTAISNQLTDTDPSPIFILCFAIYIYTSNMLSFSAKLALIPSLILIFFAFLFPSIKSKNNDPYMISTVCEGLKDIKVLSATKIGTFVEIKTETGTLLINMNTITQIRPIETSPEEAVKTPQPPAQK